MASKDYALYHVAPEAAEGVRKHVAAHLLDPRALECVTFKGDHLELAFKSGITRRLGLPSA